MTIRDDLSGMIQAAAEQAMNAGDLPQVPLPEIVIETPARPEHGDYATNLPMRLARAARGNPLDIAKAIAARISATGMIAAAEAAPPGFVNFRLSSAWLSSQVDAIVAAGPKFGDVAIGNGQRVQVEFVSANPTGPLTAGNGRGAAIGSVIASVLEAAGYDVEREYLVNDAGTQTEVFGRTLIARYLQLAGKSVEIPADGYPGEYMIDIAKRIREESGDAFDYATIEEPPPAMVLRGVELIVEGIRSDLERLGVVFDADRDGRLSLGLEGGHTRRRIIHAGGDATGAAIQRALHEAVRQTAGGDVPPIRFLDDTIATAIHLDDGRAVGVACLRDGRPTSVLAPTVLLATGGAGHLYAATTNPAGATCDGIALVLRAGAQVADLEFIQFHPTMLYTAGARGRRTLISEAVRGEGGRLVDVDGRSVTAGVHPMGDLAPRDVVADAVQTAIELTGHPCVYLDIADVGDFEARFPTVTAGVRAAGLDPASGRIPVVPGAHYLCGGVVTDESSRTAVDGLLAAGEVARTGLHGANRLASNSLLEGLVMGRRAAAVAVERREIPVPEHAERKVEQPGPVLDREQLQNMMTRHVALRRSAAGLAEVAATLAAAPRRTADSVRDIEDAALTLTASAVVAAAAARTESRGAHVRTDYPLTADVAESRVFRIVDGELREARPVSLPG